MQDMNFNAISKIVIYFSGNNQTTIKEYEYIEKYVDLFKSMKVQTPFGDTTIGHTYSVKARRYAKDNR